MEVQNRAFDPLLTKRDIHAGFIYLPLHFFALPLIVSLATVYFPDMTGGEGNLIYYSLGVLFLGIFMLPYLRRHFDALLDRPLEALFSVLGAFLLNLALSYAAAFVLMQLGDMGENPNDAIVFSLMGRDFNIMKALAVFIAPVLEETLFRGVLFGSLRRRSRFWAYAVSIALFSLYHVWQYALVYMDPGMLVYVLQYLPVSFALCWCFERSGTLWSPVMLHMLVNAISFAALPYIR